MSSSSLFTSAQETAARLRRRPRPGATPINGDIDVSFEFFPPADEAAGARLWACIQRLAPLQPRFVSVTYGAGGSTRERTHDTVKRILSETNLAPAAHLTCVDASRRDVDAVVEDYAAAGVEHIVALRGDPAERQTVFRPHPRGYQNAAELVAGIRRLGDFEITVAAYPEVHPDARSAQADLDNLKRKIDAGASRAITQFFFDSNVYFEFLDRARAAGITVPIVPGILPVTNYARVKQFAQMCGASIPAWLGVLFDGLDEAADIRQLVAATLTAEQCTGLWERGVREFHFYTLNRPLLTLAICHILGLRPSSGVSLPFAKKGRSG
ncbi:MAG: methylenetetrahydrofolate reductase [NAD(P)H] [Gammaproteobacteria bacterium]|nr:methylenetetrahydrofolate reductase [NAD(P)H] [Gammaproteobacteria bacterium]